jgi:hypothetical protein
MYFLVLGSCFSSHAVHTELLLWEMADQSLIYLTNFSHQISLNDMLFVRNRCRMYKLFPNVRTYEHNEKYYFTKRLYFSNNVAVINIT